MKDQNQSYRVSQLFFPEDVTADIFANHAEYQAYGQPDTTFTTDNIVSNIPSGSSSRSLGEIPVVMAMREIVHVRVSRLTRKTDR